MANRTYNFGVGRAFAVDPNDSKNTFELMTVQSVTVNFNGEVQQLHGNLALPVSAAVGKLNVEGSMNVAAVNQDAIARYMWGTSFTSGSVEQFEINQAVPATPFEITVPNPANLIDILVVYRDATGEQLTRVDSAPAAGQYEVDLDTGVITFNTAEEGEVVQIVGKQTTTSGRNYEMKNYIMGSNKPFQLDLFNEFQGTKQGMVLTNVLLTSFSEAWTNDNYGVPTMNIVAFADASGRLGYRYFGQNI